MRAIIANICKRFENPDGTVFKALEDVNLTISEGEFVAVVGRSGCGKSTLLNIVAGLLSATEGEVVFEDLSSDNRPLTSVVFQDLALFPWRSVKKNITYGMEEQKVPSQIREERAGEWIELVGLKGFEEHYPHQLSGGMKQRAAIARALAVNPELLLMDEPFSALDAQIRMDMQLELSRIYETTGRSFLYITHYIPEAVFLADRVVIMGGTPGRIQSIVSIDLPRPREEKIKVSSKFVAYLDRIWGEVRGKPQKFGADR
ncbi:MAG: nitrate ABC transporter ATP-binding protein [Desulfobacteraceae bacterium 4572_87]|nr:MAG: nitrate ABC transporter ATP-binding protein [Desulfobacteraceae bacterium 4572_87]